MKKNLLSMVMMGAALLFACCTPDNGGINGGNGENGENGGNPVPQPTAFAITTDNITHSSVDVTVTPSEADAWWFSTMYSEEELELYAQNDAMAAAKVEITYYLDVIKDYNANVAEGEKLDLTTFGFDSILKGTQTLTANWISPETTYIVIVVEVNGEGIVSEKATTAKFTSAARPQGNTVTFEPMMATLECYGDIYGVGTNDQVLSLYTITDSGNVAALMTEHFTTPDNHDGVGTYVVDNLYFSGEAGTFWPGSLYEGYLYPTCYVEQTGEGEIVSYDFIVDGSFSIAKNEDESYTINAELVGENGATYKVDNYTYTLGEDTYYDECSAAAAALLSKTNKNHAIKVANPTSKKVLKACSFGAKDIRR